MLASMKRPAQTASGTDWKNSAHFGEDVTCRDCHKGKHESADDVARRRGLTVEQVTV